MSVKPVKNTSPADLIASITDQLNSILLGKDKCVKLSLACVLAKGNLLIEDLPGMGKTTLAHGLAAVLALQFKRVQFTSDLLPGDVLGASIFNPKTSEFEFRAGPIFTQILLADEINRSSPKTQSALLEAMSENQVTVDGISHPLDEHFFVIATQNSQHQTGTFPLPESQLDRFMMRISLGYPDPESERELLQGLDPKQRLEALRAELSAQALKQLQDIVGNISVSDHLLDYFQRLLAYTRESGDFSHGLSPRAALAWLHCAKAWALIHQRHYVVPEDIQQLMLPVVGHRLLPSELETVARNVVDKIIRSVPIVV
ncbi:MAG: MoxR-like ATPase [Pseudohongiellaceae bacterium]|jgi:MoxR-like ATPase